MRTNAAMLLGSLLVSGAGYAQFGDDTPDRPEEMAPASPGVEPVIPLNKDDPTYNLLFISFDIDAIDPAYMPGTGTPEPGGLTTREAFPLVRRLCAETNVVGFDLVELLPYRDPGYTTVLNSNRLVRECLVGLALRKKGITEEHFLSPKTVDDGRQ